MPVEIRRRTERFVERSPGRRTSHAFSFGSVYDEAHVRFGPMVCHDEHLLTSGAGFPDHDHGDLVIVSWVVTGALTHSSPGSDPITLTPGSAGVLHTGGSTTHSEVASAPQTLFVQTWLTAPPGGEASYEVLEPPFSPLPGASFSVLHLDDGETVTIPAAPRVHVYVARGALLRSSLAEPLHAGDAFLFTDEPAHELTAGVPSELLVWEFAD